MTAVELEIEVYKRVKTVLEYLQLQKPLKRGEEDSEYGYVKVLEGFPLPSERGKENEDVPSVALRVSEGSDKEEECITKVNMEIITYKNDDKYNGYIGHRNALVILERIRQELRKNRHNGLYDYVEMRWEVLKLDGSFAGVAADMSFKIPLVKEEGTIIDDLIG